MVAENTIEPVSFPSMPNFRQINDFAEETKAGKLKYKLYRSSRPDFLTETEVKSFKNLGLKSIIDFRSPSEYRKAKGNKLLDGDFPVYKVQLPFRFRYKPNEKVTFKKIKGKKSLKSGDCSENESDTITNGESNGPQGKHYLLDFFRMNYVVAVFNRAPWYVRLYSMLYLILDFILNTGYRYFVGLFARKVLNLNGLTGQYIDMLTYSQASMCAALKILSKPENLPAMINCAHGKDRTGLVTALTLTCLGKPKDYIAMDYERSEKGLESIRDRVYDELVNHFQMSDKFVGARAESILGALEFIEAEYGSVTNYLEYIGFSKSEQEQLRKNLSECY